MGNRYRDRRPKTRPLLPVVAIVCDDTKTAAEYFKKWASKVSTKVTVHVYRAPRAGADADAVVERAREVLEELQRDSSATDDQQSVWALIDMECEPDRQRRAVAAKNQGEKNGIGVALSKPCFEVWTLLHLEDTGRSFDDCKAVTDAIKPLWQKEFGQPFESKAQVDYAKLLPRMDEAASRARKHRADPSWTEVYRVIEDVLEKMKA